MKKLFVLILFAMIGLRANAQTAYITNSGDNTVSVINVAKDSVINTIAVGDVPYGLSISPTIVYVVNYYSNTVSVISSITNKVIATIRVGKWPFGVAVSDDGSKAYVTNSDSSTVSVINTATNTATATIAVGNTPEGISVVPSGSKVYVANSNANTVSVINTVTNTITATVTVGTYPYGISISPDGSKAYVVNASSNTVSVINTASDTIMASISVGNGPTCVSVSPNGNKVYVASGTATTGIVSVINSATNTVTATVTVGSDPYGISVSPDGSKIYVANMRDNTISVIKSSTNTVISTIPVGNSPMAFGNFISIFPLIPDTICSAKFTLVPSSTPHLYYVTDTITGIPPYKYLWSWGDGTHDTIAYPTRTYSTAGNYTIYLTIKDSTGCTSIYCDSSYLQKSTNSIITVDVVPKVLTAINEKELSNQIKVYPNPSTDNITIETTQAAVGSMQEAVCSVEIYNLLGEKVYQSLVTSHSSLGILPMTNAPMTINVADFQSGVYVVEVKTEKGGAVRKFVKE